MQIQGEMEDTIQEARNAEEKAKKAITDVSPLQISQTNRRTLPACVYTVYIAQITITCTIKNILSRTG